jgi:hypothetical protein
MLVALVNSGDDDSSRQPGSAPTSGGAPLVAPTAPLAVQRPVVATPVQSPFEGAVGLPLPGPGNVPIVPSRIVIVLDDGSSTAARDPGDRRHKDLRAFGSWLVANNHPRSRIIVGRSGSGPARYGTPVTARALASGELGTGARRRAPRVPGLSRTITIHVSAVERGGLPAPSRVVRIVPTSGATLPGATADLTGPATVAVDVAKRNTVAATAARAVMQASRQVEQPR